MHGTNMMKRFFKNFAIGVYVCIGFLLTQTVSYASAIQQQQSTLYPYNNIIELQEDFVTGMTSSGVIGHLNWFTSGGTTSSASDPPTELGYIRKATSSVSGTVANLLISGNQNDWTSANVHQLLYRVRLNTNDANTTVRIGESNSCTVSPITSSGVYFEKLDADTTWFGVTKNTGTETRTDTGVSVSTSWTYFSINVTPTSVEFFINNALVATNTTNIPTGSISPCAHIVNSSAADKTFDIGYYQSRTFISR